MTNTFGVTLSKFIKASGFTNDNLAVTLKMTSEVMHEILSGQRIPEGQMIQVIARVLDLTRPETDFLYFLANKIPVDVGLFKSIRDYSTVMAALRNGGSSELVTNNEATETSPIYQVTTPGEIRYYWLISESTIRKLVRAVDHKRSGRTKLVLISTIIKKYGPPKIPLPFEYQPLSEDHSILNQVSTFGEISKHILKHTTTILRDISLNDKNHKFNPGEYRKSRGDWIFLNTSIDRVYVVKTS